MRLDKWLKVSRLIKRRTVANEACDNGRITVGGRTVKASYEVKVGDVLELKFGEKAIRVEVLSTADIVGKADSDGDGTPDNDATEEVLKTLTVQNMSETGQPTAFSLRSNYIYSIGKYNPDQGIDQPISLLGEAIYLEVLPFEKVPATEHEFGEARVHALFDHSDNPIHNCMNEEFNIRILPPLTTIRENVQSITLTIVHDNTYAVDDNGKEV